MSNLMLTFLKIWKIRFSNCTQTCFVVIYNVYLYTDDRAEESKSEKKTEWTKFRKKKEKSKHDHCKGNLKLDS